MNIDHRDELDRTIDEVLAEVSAEEPRRVSARSVRQGLDESRPSRMPFWLAAAAVVVLGFALSTRTRGPISEAPELVTNRPAAGASLDPAAESAAPLASILASAATATMVSRPNRVRVPGTRESSSAPPEPEGGLPRLTIASIERPDPLSTAHLDADAIEIPRIEIAPLSLSTFPAEQEHNQEPPR